MYVHTKIILNVLYKKIINKKHYQIFHNGNYLLKVKYQIYNKLLTSDYTEVMKQITKTQHIMLIKHTNKISGAEINK